MWDAIRMFAALVVVDAYATSNLFLGIVWDLNKG